MVFRKKIEPRCAYCRFSAPAGEDTVACRKKGVMSASDHCRRFRYDPLRRTPPRPVNPDFTKFDDRDYSL